MKTMILTTLMMLMGATVQAAKHCAGNNTVRELSSAAEEIQSQLVKDDRIAIDRTSEEFKMLNAIGVVSKTDKSGYGTGYLVDACHVLTNNHVVYSKGQESKNGVKVHFSVGQTGSKTQPFTHTAIEGKVIAHEKYDHTTETSNQDWVVIRLSKPIGKQVGHIPLYQMSSEKMVTQSIVTGGFPGDKTQNGADLSKMYVDPACKILGMGAFGYVLHTCQVAGGQSGSPLLAKAPNGKYYAVGMVSGDKDSNGLDRNVDPEKANIAVNFESGKPYGEVSEGDKILAAIQADPCE